MGELVKLEVRDVSGRGKGDVIVRRRQSSGDGTREYLEVLSSLAANQEPQLTFAHEIGIRQSDRHVDNVVHLSRGEIEVSIEPPAGWDAASYNEPIATDVEPLLLPWGGVKSQSFRFNGSRFAKAKEVTQDGAPGAPPEGGPHAMEQPVLNGNVSSEGSPIGGEQRSRPAMVRPPEQLTPRVARGGDLSAQVLDQYRKDRGAPSGVAPKVDLQVQVASDPRPERVLLVGRDIVVLGPGFKDGTGYAFVTLQQFADAGDVRDMSARDLTGDGAADLIVRGVRRVTDGKTNVEIETMFVYQVKDDSINRVFGIETAREHKGKRIQGLVQFVPAANGKAFDIVSAPGRATGWNAKTFPWAQERPGDGTLEPLLLPWGGIGSVRYSWNGSHFTR